MTYGFTTEWPSRRTLLESGAVTFLAAGAAGCDRLATDPSESGQGGAESAGDSAQKQAPMLDDLVRDGQLPPLEERLPEEPLVVEPVEEIGAYGGTWRGSMVGPSDTGWLDRVVGYEPLLRWQDWGPSFGEGIDVMPELLPNIARDYEVNDDGRVYTLMLRPGMRWSDGKPFTADDILFWFEAVFSHEELTPVPSSWLFAGGEPVQVTKVDDHTVQFTFAIPHGIFIPWLATPLSDELPRHPRHYLEQFHQDFNPDVNQIVEQENAPNWVELFHQKRGPWENPDLPTLNAWKPLNAIGDGDGIRFERNPYYWKVDPQRRQLPYIDRIDNQIVNETEAQLLSTRNGEIDMIDTYIGYVTTNTNKPTLAENRESGGYEFYDVIPNRMNLIIISLNLTHQNPALREVFQNKDFRIGLSHAINRTEIIEVVYAKQGRGYQVVERPESPLFDEELATQYTDYDVDVANDYLDRAGFAERDDAGFRLGPDGGRISFTIDVATQRPEWPDSLEMVSNYWKVVGIDAQVRSRTPAYLTDRAEANEHDANVWSTSAGVDMLFDPKYLFPLMESSYFAVPWGEWYASGGHDGEEPPAPAKRQMDLYDQFKVTGDPDERVAAMREIFSISKEQFYCIGIIQPTEEYGVATTRMRNVPRIVVSSTHYPHPGPSNPPQFFIQD